MIRFIRCKRCNIFFHTSKRNKRYCKTACQDPRALRNITRDVSSATFKKLEALDRRPGLLDSVKEFERVTGIPFITSFEHLPKKSFRHLPNEEPREEQGQVWWNMDRWTKNNEADPLVIESRLRAYAKRPVVHQGETVEEFLARGGVIRKLPPGKARELQEVYTFI